MIFPLLGKKRSVPLPLQRLWGTAALAVALVRQEAALSFVKQDQWTEEQIASLPAGEHDYFERKSGQLFDPRADTNKLYDALAKEACAFANSGGGHLLLGVCDDGTIDGVPPLFGKTETREWLEQKIPDLLDYRLVDFRVHTVLSFSAISHPSWTGGNSCRHWRQCISSSSKPQTHAVLL